MTATAPCGDLFCHCGCGAEFGACRHSFLRLRAIQMPSHEDDPPFRSYRIMTQDDQSGDMRALETERAQAGDTQPPDPAEEALAIAAMGTMLPPAVGVPPVRESYFELAARDFAASLIEMKATRKEIADGFKQQERSAKKTRSDVAKATRAQEANYQLVYREVVGLKDSLGTFRRETEERFAALDAEIKLLKQRVQSQQDKLEEQQKKVDEQKSLLADQQNDLEQTKQIITEIEKRCNDNVARSTEASTAAASPLEA